ncbi:FecR family protein [Chitinophaga sp. RAB17]|uniref:FecR family protein n=1 Tax=Chitinophaga sp. RAB17 TaxID=3233049 RepID=UPI003F92799F
MEDISIEKLVGDPSFINYCFHTNENDVRYWNNWLQGHPEQAALIREAVDMVKTAGWLLQAEREKPAAMAKMDEWLLNTGKPARRMRWYYTAAAAAVILVFLTVWHFRPVSIAPPGVATVVRPLQLYYHNTSKVMQGVLLPDSSYVLLESGASLQLENAFGKSARGMALNGTAYFKVSRDPLRPFNVKGAEYIITALGTAFRMTSANGKLQVLLEEGKVMVEKNSQGTRKLITYLMPAESLLIDPASRNTKQQQRFTPATLNAWKAQEILFDHTPVPEVVLQLEACYNIHIQIADTILQKEVFSGRFKNDALPAVLEVLCFTLNKQYQFADSANVLIK